MKKLVFTLLATIAAYASFAQCSAVIAANQSPNNNNLLWVYFTNNSITTLLGPDDYNSWLLNYGDGNIYTGTNPSLQHVYNLPGTYAVGFRMDVIDCSSNTILCSDSTTLSVTVSYPDCGTQIASTDMGGGIFNFTFSIPAGTTGLTYSWDFGDGNTSNLQNPTHTYALAGSYMATLVTTGAGCQYTNAMTVSNFNGGIGNCSGLAAGFTFTTSGSSAYFTNTSTQLNVPTVGMSSFWEYGDGANGQASSHTYNASGTYYVVLHQQWTDSLNNTTCADSFYQAVTVGNPVPGTYTFGGIVVYDSASYPQSQFMVYLIQHDSTANTLTAVDSTIAPGGFGGFAFYEFANPTSGSYLVKAVPLGQMIGGAGMIPTYHDSALYWSNAPYQTFAGNTNVYGVNIWMQSGIVTNGPGFVGGNISQGANKGTSSGVEGIVVYLRNSMNELVASDMTDNNGDYSFSNIASGIYNVYPEDMGLATTPSGNLTVYSSGQTSVTDVDFVRNSTSIVPVTLSIGKFEGADIFALYPNPAQNTINVSTKASADVTIFNTIGSKVLDANVKAGTNQINLNGLPNGLYQVKVQNGTAMQTQKLIIQR